MAMCRLASSKVVPNALRAMAYTRILSGSITNAFSGTQDSIAEREISPNSFSHHFSTDAKNILDRKLVKILKSEIKFKQLFQEKAMPSAPADFPFAIQDDPCNKDITLTRVFDGEKIEVVVYTPRDLPEYDEEETDFSDIDISDDDNNDNDESKDNGGGGGEDNSSSTDSNSDEENETSSADLAPSVGLHLHVKISKENGKNMDFGVYASANEIKIGTMSVKEPASDNTLTCFGEYSVEPDSDLQFALREFLEIRGINKSYVGFLYKYIVRKSIRDPTLVLKKLKKFIKDK